MNYPSLLNYLVIADPWTVLLRQMQKAFYGISQAMLSAGVQGTVERNIQKIYHISIAIIQ